MTLSFSAKAVFVEGDQFSEDNERLLLVELNDGTPISQMLSAFLVGEKWFLPIGELADALGFSIQVSVKLGQAQGHLVTEDRVFELNASQCKFINGGKAEAFECKELSATDFDIFVSAELLQRMWPLKFEFNSYASELSIEPLIKLPAQEQAERRKRPVHQPNLSNQPQGASATAPDDFLDGFSLDQQLTLGLKDEGGSGLIHSSLVTSEFSGLQMTAFVEGTANEFSSERLSLYRADPLNQGRLPFALTEINMLDGAAEGLPLIGGGGLYRGVMVSNQPLNRPMIFDQKDFTGELAEGWEVELYQNGILIGRQVGEKGRYRFESIPLSYGSNRFVFKFYGPQGEKLEKSESITIDRSLIQRGEFLYRIAGGEERQGVRTGDFMQLQSTIGISNRSSAFMGFSQFTNLRQEKLRYSLMGLRSLWKEYFFNLSNASESNGGMATELSVSRNLGINHLKLSYLYTEDFISPEIDYSSSGDLTQIISLRSTLQLPWAIRTDFELGQAGFNDRDPIAFYKNKLSFRTGPLFWFNNLEFDGVSEQLMGEGSVVARIRRHELRFSSLYSQEEARSYSLNFRSYWNDLFHSGLSYQVDLLSEVNSLSANLSRDFKSFTASVELGQSEINGTYSNALLSYNIGREPRRNSLEWSAKSSANSGMTSLLIFVDTNGNAKKDDDEAVLEGIGVSINGQSQKIKSDHRGIIYLSGLPIHEPLSFEIDLMTLENPNLKPPKGQSRIWLRPGKPALIDLPVAITSEVTGYLVSEAKASDQVRGLSVELLDRNDNLVSKTRSESDGFFIFEGVVPGEYKIKIAEEILIDRDLHADITVIDFVVEADGWLDKELIFRLESSR